jgi:hypothetical protein
LPSMMWSRKPGTTCPSGVQRQMPASQIDE